MSLRPYNRIRELFGGSEFTRLLSLHGYSTVNVFLMSCHLLMQIVGHRCRGIGAYRTACLCILHVFSGKSCWPLGLALLFIFSSCWAGVVSVAVCKQISRNMPNWDGKGMKKQTDICIDKLGLGGLGLLIEKSQPLKITVNLLYTVEQGGGVITHTQLNKEAGLTNLLGAVSVGTEQFSAHKHGGLGRKIKRTFSTL